MANRSKSPPAADRTRAWVLALLALAADAFDVGTPVVSDAGVVGLYDGAPLLQIDILPVGAGSEQRRQLLAAQAAGVCVEYWQLAANGKRCWLYQRGADGVLMRTAPDAAGTHYTLLSEDFRFPMAWFAARPQLLDMMQAWQLIE
jgi:hypothetical protein